MKVTVGRSLLDTTNQTFVNVMSVGFVGPTPFEHHSVLTIDLKAGGRFVSEAYGYFPLQIVCVDVEPDDREFSVGYASDIDSAARTMPSCLRAYLIQDNPHSPSIVFVKYDEEFITFEGRFRIRRAFLPTVSDPASRETTLPAPEKLPLRKLLLKGDNPFAGLKYIWTGDVKRLGRCSVRLDEFCERCCPGGIDGRCWFAEGKVVAWTPPEVAIYIVRQEPEPSVNAGTGRKLLLKGGSP